jgi:hypothetical protein
LLDKFYAAETLPHLWQLTVSLSGWSLGKFVILELHPHTRSAKALIQLATLRAGMARESLAKAYYELGIWTAPR